MSTTLRYRVNSDRATHQTIDGEVVILNLECGHYYSLVGTAAEIWSGLEGSRSVAELVSELRARYTDPAGTIEPNTRAFLDELVAEGLVVAEPSALGKAPIPTSNRVGEQPRTRFEAPSIEKYTDLEALLLLDPIHNVDETGWPTPWR